MSIPGTPERFSFTGWIDVLPATLNIRASFPHPNNRTLTVSLSGSDTAQIGADDGIVVGEIGPPTLEHDASAL